ncbi:MAG TPA: SpoIIE family protein phosphatase [Spirochaetia bacterium]|nr:SpoIIE family protein phosphatase [Spirochaetia bacterium]
MDAPNARSRRAGRGLALAAACAACALLVSPSAEAAPTDFYWEAPARLSKGVGAYPQAIRTSGDVIAIWQENVPTDGGGEAWLSMASYRDDGVFRRDRFAGPFLYEAIGDKAKGERSLSAPALFSADDDGNGRLLIAASAGERRVEVYASDDSGRSFRPLSALELDQPVVAPRVYSNAAGGWYLFVTRSQVFTRTPAAGGDATTYESLSIFYTRSDDGSSWAPLAPFVGGDVGLDPNFLPTAASVDGTDVVVFQTLSGGDRPSYQLYSTVSRDGGLSWSPPRRVTDFMDPVHLEAQAPDRFDNQRPHLARIGGSLWLTWERRLLSGPAQVYAARLDADGALVPDSPERVTLGQGACSEPRLYPLGEGSDEEPAIAWFDDRRGANRVFTAFKSGALWTERDLSGRSRGDGTFGRVVSTDRGLYAFWQTGSGSLSSVIGMVPDTSARPPAISAVDFAPGEPTRRGRATVRWTAPDDSSGILGFSYLWTRDPEAEPPETVMALETLTRAAFDADEDGDWFFSIKAQDYAGNWSGASRVRFVRDTTPPGKPAITPPAASADGFIASSSFALAWEPPADPDVAGYTWAVEYLGPLDRPPARKRPAPAADDGVRYPGTAYDLWPTTDYERWLWTSAEPAPPAPSLRTRSPSASFSNVDDGYWVFSVAAIDGVGNVGEPTRALLRTDKFRPYTAVTDVGARRDDFGNLELSVVGRGFLDDGAVTRLAIDADGREPFDYVFSLADRQYSIASDRLLRVAEVSDLQAGSYRIGLYHPERGWYFTAPRLAVDYSGTVKFGERGAPWSPTWSFAPAPTSIVSVSALFTLAALLLPSLGIVLSLRHVVALAGQMRAARAEAIALLEGKPMPESERRRKAERAVRRGAGLTAKFAMTISLLVLFIVALVSIRLGMQMLDTQSETLARGLEQRARVLLESAVQGGKSYLPAKNVLELSLLPNQASAVAEARYLTITGFGGSGATNPDVVWASNDPDIASKIDGPALLPGVSLLGDPLSPRVASMAAEIDARANAEVGAIAEALQQMQDEGRALAANLDAASQDRLAEIASGASVMERELSERLATIADASVASEPPFDATRLGATAEEYVFYKPILFRQGREALYYRGLVRLSVSTETIVAQVNAARDELVRSVAVVAAIALAIGVVGAFGLSRIIIGPLMKVVRGIETIRDESDKRKLADFSIDVKSRDELSILAGTINEMTAGLVEAAKEAEFLTVGKEVQKMFIPLVTNELGEKLTTGYDDQAGHVFFGYYEGAKGVSGDYFDYTPLDGRFWAFIKCDVSGKGVPAALIMVGVATIFTTELQGWSFKRDGIHLDRITYKINDFIEKRGFKGRFAAFIMGVYDSQTGAAYVCHAGDNILRVYEADKGAVVTHTLDSAPTAGTFPNDLVESTSPYKQVLLPLGHGDTMLLYTDGFEESSRAMRGPDFKPLYRVQKLRDRDGNESEHREAQVEQLGEERIKAVTEAIMSRGSYSLRKEGDPLGPDAAYDFDFSTLDAGPDDLVLGIAAVEKVFRIIPDPTAGADDKVIVDARIDEVLAKCWKQYARFCRDRQPHPDPRRKEYLYYGHLKEDEQYDDLTMMLIRRK